MTALTYQASPIKRIRSTKAEVEARREALLDIIDDGRPMTVRQVFYQATVRGLVEKTETGYAKVQTDLTVMRRAGDLPYDWLADNTRWQRKPRTFDSVEDALQETAEVLSQGAVDRRRLLRRDLAGEGRARRRRLSGHRHVRRAADGGARLRLPLVPAQRRRIHQRRSTSRPTSTTSATSIRPASTPARRSRRRCASWRPTPRSIFERIAVTPEQIGEWDLPTRPTKKADTRSKGFGEISVELDAIEPNQLRALVQDAIEQHLPAEQFEVLKAAEESEREIISRLVHTATKRRAKGGAR